MHFRHYKWTTEKLSTLRSTIHPKPQYQRGVAWGNGHRALLIDSMLKGFDIPKIYLRHTKNVGQFDYEVADGQQRLTAIWSFLDGDLVLEGMTMRQSHLNGKRFVDLSESEKRQVLQYEFVTTVVYSATNDEIRELFRRLQLGVRLNPAEIRNSMASALGNVIRAMALSHPFFSDGRFSTARYKADDLLAHAFAIVIYKRERDIKAPDLHAMYIDHKRKIDAGFAEGLNEILHFLNKVQQEQPRCVKTKWGFVDLVGVLANRKLKILAPAAVASAYVKWEEDRARMIARLSELASARAGSHQAMLFEYISAFQKEGATKKNLQTRFRVLDSVLP